MFDVKAYCIVIDGKPVMAGWTKEQVVGFWTGSDPKFGYIDRNAHYDIQEITLPDPNIVIELGGGTVQDVNADFHTVSYELKDCDEGECDDVDEGEWLDEDDYARHQSSDEEDSNDKDDFMRSWKEGIG